jgi:hypothetical protein
MKKRAEVVKRAKAYLQLKDPKHYANGERLISDLLALVEGE